MTNTAYLLPNSLFIAAIVATQGVYSKQNTSSDIALLAGKKDVIETGKRTCNVDTTVSFARNPVINDTVIRQSSNPKGLKIGDIIVAIFDRIDSSVLSTKSRLNEKLSKNQITIDAINITVKALCKKSFAFSHNSCDTDLRLGIL